MSRRYLEIQNFYFYIGNPKFGNPKIQKEIIKFWGIRHLKFKIFLGSSPRPPQNVTPLSNTLATCLHGEANLCHVLIRGELWIVLKLSPIVRDVQRQRGSGDGQRLSLYDYGMTERSFDAVERRGSTLNLNSLHGRR